MSADLRPHHNIDATLLETAVAQFIARDIHPAGDIKVFEELTLGLIERLDPDTAANIIHPLCAHPDTPPRILARLYELNGGAANHDATQTQNLSRLRELAADLSLRPDPLMRQTLARAARDDLALARILLDRDDLDLDPAPYFLAATRLERLAIVLDACRKALTNGGDGEILADPEFAAQFEQAATARSWIMMAELAAISLQLNPDRAQMLIMDASGEAFALLMRAFGVEPGMSARILLYADPAIAQNEERIKKLIALMRATPQRAAARIIAAIARDAETAPSPTSARRATIRATASPIRNSIETGVARKIPGAA